MPRGGRRPGAGRKPKDWRPADVLAHPSSAPAPSVAPEIAVEEFEAPASLSADERAVWVQQAPFAFKHRTLTRATSMAFERYCKVVALERIEAQSSGRGGPNHRGLLKQINAYELQFLLTPAGKPMPVPAGEQAASEPVSALARFRR